MGQRSAVLTLRAMMIADSSSHCEWLLYVNSEASCRFATQTTKLCALPVESNKNVIYRASCVIVSIIHTSGELNWHTFLHPVQAVLKE